MWMNTLFFIFCPYLLLIPSVIPSYLTEKDKKTEIT